MYIYIYIHIYIYSVHIHLHNNIHINIYIYIYIYNAVSNGKRKPQAFFFNPFTVCSSHKRKFIVSPFADEETNGNYPFPNELNRLNGLNGSSTVR